MSDKQLRSQLIKKGYGVLIDDPWFKVMDIYSHKTHFLSKDEAERLNRANLNHPVNLLNHSDFVHGRERYFF